MLTERRALFSIVERGLGAILNKGSGKCRKITQSLDETFASGSGDPPTETLNGEMRLVLRARCGLCHFRTKCKEPLL